jgi:hypothetical protein
MQANYYQFEHWDLFIHKEQNYNLSLLFQRARRIRGRTRLQAEEGENLLQFGVGDFYRRGMFELRKSLHWTYGQTEWVHRLKSKKPSHWDDCLFLGQVANPHQRFCFTLSVVHRNCRWNYSQLWLGSLLTATGLPCKFYQIFIAAFRWKTSSFIDSRSNRLVHGTTWFRAVTDDTQRI